jgi:hypothetical protein
MSDSNFDRTVIVGGQLYDLGQRVKALEEEMQLLRERLERHERGRRPPQESKGREDVVIFIPESDGTGDNL